MPPSRSFVAGLLQHHRPFMVERYVVEYQDRQEMVRVHSWGNGFG